MATCYSVSRVLDTYTDLNVDHVQACFNYNSFVSMEQRFLFIAVPKAACTTMKYLLREISGAEPLQFFVGHTHETRRDMFVHARENVPYPSLTALNNNEQRYLLESPDVLRFTIVRNPYTRLLSAWRDKAVLCEPSAYNVYRSIRGTSPPLKSKAILTFAEFVSYLENETGHIQDAHWRKQIDLTFPKALSFTHVGKVVHLNATIEHFAKHLNRSGQLTIGKSNETLIRPAAMWTKELAARVHALYVEDFEAFGYDPASWPRDETNNPSSVSEERLIDEIIERNLIIEHLYDETERIERMHKSAYRFSIQRLIDGLRSVVQHNHG